MTDQARDPEARPRVLSGIQPTADSFHLGNYLGALRNWVAMQRDYETFYTIVDLHAITVPQDPEVLAANTRVSFAQTLAAGVDPERSAVFVQSHVPEHTQLAWVLMCLTGFGEASRMTQFKDKAGKSGTANASVGLFTYPILQAADILLYQATKVPVGADQRQHLELTRDLAGRFNSRFGDTFVVPEPHVLADAAKVLDLSDPTAKMSKSTPAGCVFLLEEPKRITKKIKSAVTDSEAVIRYDPQRQPGVANLLEILSALQGEAIDDLVEGYSGVLYGTLKGDVAEAVVAFAEPFAQRTREYLEDPAELDRLMAVGAQKARAVAADTLQTVYRRIGFVPAG
ncbi:MAG: tryptophan--tRNA ligase [Actinobacteria bacterium]|nr:tryptophan--tRNA ligase [Actinomycetota bacterium]